jgi:hypothetical protein
MSSSPAGRLLISHITLRGPELAQVYARIVAHPELGADDLRAYFGSVGGSSPFELADAPLRETLSFLCLAGLVEVRGRQRRYTASPRLTGVPFPLLLLHHLRVHPEERQRAIGLVHHSLAGDDILNTTATALRDRLERGPLRDLFAWTGEKVNFWAHLAGYLGLIRRVERSSELLAVPSLSLLHSALIWAIGEAGSDLSLDAVLRRVDAELFACFTVRGRIHKGFAQALLALERLGTIRLSHSADAARSLLLGERRVSDLALLEAVS